jgi:hypothetical protein
LHNDIRIIDKGAERESHLYIRFELEDFAPQNNHFLPDVDLSGIYSGRIQVLFINFVNLVIIQPYKTTCSNIASLNLKNFHPFRFCLLSVPEENCLERKPVITNKVLYD